MKKQTFSVKAFTLVELIVIVSISVLLLTVSMLVTGCGEESSGSSGSSKSSGSSMSLDTEKNRKNCMSQLKQIGLAIIMYSEDSKGYVPAWDGYNKNEVATNSNKIYNATKNNSSGFATPGNKLLLGGYLGEYLNSVNRSHAKKFFACPSDNKIFDGKQASSYIYMPILTESSDAKRRIIMGRDNPGAALMYDMHSALTPGNTGGAAVLPDSGGNHQTAVNVLYLGGQCGSVSAKKAKSITFKELDQITY